MFGLAFPWRTGLLATVVYLVLALQMQLLAYDNPSMLSWILCAALGPLLVLNMKVMGETEDEATFLQKLAIISIVFHLMVYLSSLFTVIIDIHADSDGLSATFVMGSSLACLLPVVIAWIMRKIIQVATWLWNTIIEWVAQDWV